MEHPEQSMAFWSSSILYFIPSWNFAIISSYLGHPTKMKTRKNTMNFERPDKNIMLSMVKPFFMGP